MLINEAYHPINCDDYDNLEQLKAKAKEIFSRKNVEYLAIDLSGEHRELRLDHIASFTHPELGTVVVSAE